MQDRLMLRKNKRVPFAGNGKNISHSRAGVAVLRGGRDYQRCNVGTTVNREHGCDEDHMVEFQPTGNAAYKIVDLHDVDETALGGETENILERDRTKQKKPSISPLHDLQEGQRMSVGCVVGLLWRLDMFKFYLKVIFKAMDFILIIPFLQVCWDCKEHQVHFGLEY